MDVRQPRRFLIAEDCFELSVIPTQKSVGAVIRSIENLLGRAYFLIPILPNAFIDFVSSLKEVLSFLKYFLSSFINSLRTIFYYADSFRYFEVVFISMSFVTAFPQDKCCSTSILEIMWKELFQVSRIYKRKLAAVPIWEHYPYFGLQCRYFRGGYHAIAATFQSRTCWLRCSGRPLFLSYLYITDFILLCQLCTDPFFFPHK